MIQLTLHLSCCHYYSAVVTLVEVIALSSQSQMATGSSHIKLLLIHLDWSAQPSLLHAVCIRVHACGSDILVKRGLISEVAVAFRRHVNRTV